MLYFQNTNKYYKYLILHKEILLDKEIFAYKIYKKKYEFYNLFFYLITIFKYFVIKRIFYIIFFSLKPV